jgi:hypothetical protein
MDFLEKDLETIIAENYEACAARGLDIKQTWSLQFRQLNLGAYGIADLVNIGFDGSALSIQVIECKKDEINIATYLQAKRYLAGIKHILDDFIDELKDLRNGYVEDDIVLIGKSIDNKSDFVFLHSADYTCSIFLYSYQVDGIHFEEVSKNWTMSMESHQAARTNLRNAVFDKVKEVYATEVQQQEAWAQRILESGDSRFPLLVTPNGVLLNIDLLERNQTRIYY